MKDAALVVALAFVTVTGGCGGGGDQVAAASQAPHLGHAQFATNDSSTAGEAFDDDAVMGEPSLDVDLVPPAGLGTAQASCSGTNLTPDADNLAAVRKATLCLLNAERTSRGLRALRLNSDLALAALRHSRDMVKNKYFAHTSPPGVTFVQRIRKTGYFDGYKSWTAGENLAWGAGSSATPAEIVRAWMNSTGHRANILNGKFRQTGFGIVIGLPVNGYTSGATYSNEFGKRS
jgi:uncharacterized protein YkwD